MKETEIEEHLRIARKELQWIWQHLTAIAQAAKETQTEGQGATTEAPEKEDENQLSLF